jgi:ferredoxin
MALGGIAVAASGKPETRGRRKWGVAVDLKRCTGCQACTLACKLENSTPSGAFWAHVFEKVGETFPFAYKIFISLRCIAAPVRDDGGNITAAVGVFGVVQRLTKKLLLSPAPSPLGMVPATSPRFGYPSHQRQDRSALRSVAGISNGR